MNRPKLAVPLLAAAAALLVTAGCGRKHEAVAPPAEPSAVSAPVAVAEVAAAPATIEVTGSVEPIERVSPGTKLMGRVERVMVGEGDAVRAGQTLARLESRDLAASVEQAKAGVAMAEAQLANAEAMHRRMTELAGRGSATAKNLEDATAGYNMAQAGLQQAKANLSAAQVMLGYAVITTPISGFVTAKRIETATWRRRGCRSSRSTTCRGSRSSRRCRKLRSLAWPRGEPRPSRSTCSRRPSRRRSSGSSLPATR